MTQPAVGRDGISLNGSEVRRPFQPWSNEVHKLLSFLAQAGYETAPQLIRVETDQQQNHWEVLTLVEGETYDFPLTGPIASTTALKSCAQLLKRYHTLSAAYLKQLRQRPGWQQIEWMLPSRQPIEVLCHGDFSPYNVALNKETVTGVFDFDTVHPGPALWDVAYTVYCFAPFKTDEHDQLFTLDHQIQRAKLFCDSYGLDNQQRTQLVQVMQDRVQALVDFMQSSQGGEYGTSSQFGTYKNDIKYMHSNRDTIIQGLTAP